MLAVGGVVAEVRTGQNTKRICGTHSEREGGPSLSWGCPTSSWGMLPLEIMFCSCQCMLLDMEGAQGAGTGVEKGRRSGRGQKKKKEKASEDSLTYATLGH